MRRARPANRGTASSAAAPISRTRRPRSRMTAPCTLPLIADAAVPGRSEYGKTWRCVSGECSRYARQLLEVVVGLAGKADDDVGADRGVRNARADVVDERRVVLDRVRPAHRARACGRSRAAAADENAARSDRDAATRSTISREQSIGSSELMRKRTSRGLKPTRYAAVERSQQIDQRRPAVEVAAVRAQVDAGQRDFLEAGGGHALDFAQHIVERHAARRASRRRDDAVRARLGAAGLHAQRERGAAGDAGLDRARRSCRRRRRSVSAVVERSRRSAPRGRGAGHSRGLSSFGTTCTTFGSAATSSGRRVA